MFGILRYVLALFVIFQHLGGLAEMGKYAVFIFFMLSGYLMTLILNENYRGNIKGYLTNRILRIYPPYVFVVAITALLVVFLPGFVYAFDLRNYPNGFFPWLGNFIMRDVHFLRPAWTMKVEFVYYIAMIFIALSRFRVTMWLLGSVAFTAYTLVTKGSLFIWGVEYASLPFSIGAFLYHLKLKTEPNYFGIGASAFFFAALCGICALLPGKDITRGVGFYGAVKVGIYLVFELSKVKASGLLKKVDSFLGDLSYPMYLSHLMLGGLMTVLLKLPVSIADNAYMGAAFWWSLLLIHPLAYGIDYLVIKPVEAYRRRIKDNKQPRMANVYLLRASNRSLPSSMT